METELQRDKQGEGLGGGLGGSDKSHRHGDPRGNGQQPRDGGRRGGPRNEKETHPGGPQTSAAFTKILEMVKEVDLVGGMETGRDSLVEQSSRRLEMRAGGVRRGAEAGRSHRSQRHEETTRLHDCGGGENENARRSVRSLRRHFMEGERHTCFSSPSLPATA